MPAQNTPLTPADSHSVIEVRGARENNLADVSLDLPKRRLTVFTGVSGSGKSSLVFGTVAAESQRLINETYTAFVQSFMPSLGRPDVDSLRNLSAAIVVDQERMGANSRSTVGTATDAYTMLRILFSRLGTPYVGPATAFGFNSAEGMCAECEGLGRTTTVDIGQLVDTGLSVRDGAITAPGFAVDSWFWQVVVNSGFFDPDKKVRDFTPEEWEALLYRPMTKVKVGTSNLTYEGVVARIRRTYLSKDREALQSHIREFVDRAVVYTDCPVCGGSRLSQAALSSRIDGRNIADCAAMQISDLAPFVRGLSDSAPDSRPSGESRHSGGPGDSGDPGEGELQASGGGQANVAPLRDALCQTLDSLVDIGLGYLSLDRPAGTLSGGEAQRVKMVRHLGSSLTDVTYVFDEPTIGLHPHDIQRMNELLLLLRDKGNTVLVVEHKPEVVAVADHVVDLGPGAGTEGGRICYEGDVPGLRASGTLTGRHLHHRARLRETVREPKGAVRITGADLHNLKNVDVDIPLGVLTVVTGVAGSGKSSLIHGYLSGRDGVRVADQSPIRGSRRSNPATYTGLLGPIRTAFAKANGVKPALFSANSAGACPNCNGIGLVWTDLAMMGGVSSVCEECEGKRYTPAVLEYTLRGKNISEVLGMSVAEAAAFLPTGQAAAILGRLADVGLSYLRLGQPLNTLSGGERQRLKLAIHMAEKAATYVLDEPTTGLHMADVDQLLALLDRLVEDGNSVVVIEHHQAVMAHADWIIDLGPGGGHDGGEVLFTGAPAELVTAGDTLTARHLRDYVGAEARQPAAG
ncbi:daunorubicin resistance protein DrrC [Streptomyces qinglanensis]|uniref:UvrABC system protein A n=1 Tax=Streptomyces qinglanensis TaxID=943816 RepID=A0A1E7KED5_9ACTN|nr:excinuclease ABC subunit UvrA [Streptomyces qinglanensis]OEV02281.1 daunorubicin resistance protein DrrC [Streptomyces qinglanensis]OEV27030.1 daunorubicin resistance protein DrrC [Streptomyces nanshensis]